MSERQRPPPTYSEWTGSDFTIRRRSSSAGSDRTVRPRSQSTDSGRTIRATPSAGQQEEETNPTFPVVAPPEPANSEQTEAKEFIPLPLATSFLHGLPDANPNQQSIHEYYLEFALLSGLDPNPPPALRATRERRAEIIRLYELKIGNGGISKIEFDHMMRLCNEVSEAACA